MQRIRDRLAGQYLLVTGSTGFLAKAVVEKLLRSVDTIAGICLLVRTRPDGRSAKQRVWRDVLASQAFDRQRAALGDRFAELCEEKIDVVAGDLTRERLGLSSEDYEALTKRVTLVINSAATVTFDERLDLAVELNALGPQRLLAFARDCGNVPFLHVSTCYVCGMRSGVVVEDFSAPECARESLPRDPATGAYDLDALVQSLRSEAAGLSERFGADTEACRRELIEAGMNRARLYGWSDTYTFTKWIGEQLLVRDRGDVPLVIFRPAIIEGAYEEPTPGWLDGLRMADPIIVAYGRGKLDVFPGVPGVALDLIPVDFVANAMICVLPVGEGFHHDLRVYQCASSDRNPLPLADLLRSLERAFALRPMNGEDGRPIFPRPFRLSPQEAFHKRLRGKQRLILRLQRLMKMLHLSGRRMRRLSALSRQIEQLIYFSKIYSPYTHLDCRFSEDALLGVADELHPDDKGEFPFDVGRINWDDYIVNRHVPGLRSFVLGTGSEPTARLRAGVREDVAELPSGLVAIKGRDLFEIFRHSAERFGDKPALQIKRNGRWLRYTYGDALRATGTIMQRFIERGLQPGERIAICGESGPEWGLTYLAAMRAGLTAVPLDPLLPAKDALFAARFAGARLLFSGASTLDGLERLRGAGDPEVVAMGEPFVPPPGASRDRLPDPVAVEGTSLASILFTSGTTVDPKAVPLTHRNLIANAAALLEVHPIHPADEFLSVLPMYHAFEFTGGFLVPLARGATITYVEQLKGPEILAGMQATGTTIMLVVPRLLRAFHGAIESHLASAGPLKRAAFGALARASDLTGHRWGRRLFGKVHKRFGGHLRMFVSGGSRLDPNLHHEFARMGFSVYEGYGLTETSPVLTVNPSGGVRPGSVGRVLPNVELEVRNQNLEGVGEVWVKGPSIMSGYLDNPEANREILSEGWLRTGDLGRCDSDGYLYLTGRSTDLIVTGAGKNVYPDDVEQRYQDLPYVKEFCVFGMPSEDGLGDTVHAVVVIDEEAAPGLDRSSIEREVRIAAAAVAESQPSHQRIAAMHFWECNLPKTSTLKAKRGVIRERVCAELAARQVTAARPPAARSKKGPASDDSSSAFAAVTRIVGNQCNRSEHTILPGMHLLLDLGIDSIGKLDVIGAVESCFDMQIDDDTGAKIARVGDLFALVRNRRPRGDIPPDRTIWKRRLASRELPGRANGQPPAPLLPVRWLVRGGGRLFMKTYARVMANGLENVPAAGPFILAPNHSSHLDSPSVIAAVGGKRRIWIAGAEDYFFNTRLKRFLFGKVLDTIPFDRRADGVEGLRRCGEALSLGDGLLLFPEGTRSVTGALQPFKIGVAVLAMEREVPIVPVHIERAYELLRKGQRFPRPGRITVTFGRAVQPADTECEDSLCLDHYEACRALTRRVEAAVAKLARRASGL